MRNITYKYNLGDTVKFKDKFVRPSCGLVGRGNYCCDYRRSSPYNNKPHYYINGNTSEAYAESCFAGKVAESV